MDVESMGDENDDQSGVEKSFSGESLEVHLSGRRISHDQSENSFLHK